jgi:hypothetical protein
MTPSEQCKAAGLKSLAEMVRISSVSEQTLINWHRNKPVLFAVVVAGASVIKAANAELRGGPLAARPVEPKAERT